MPPLGSGVIRLADGALQACTRAGVDDAGVNLVAKRLDASRQRFAPLQVGQAKVALQMHAHHLVTVVFGQADEHAVAQNAGIVDQHMHLAIRRHGGVPVMDCRLKPSW